MFAEEINDEKPAMEQNDSKPTNDSSESTDNTDTNEVAKKSERKKVIKIDQSAKKESGRFEKQRPERRNVDRRGFRQGIRREEYRNKPYDALPARDQNISEILNTGNPDVINRTAEDYGKTWGDRPHWIKNRFSTFQIRPIMSKIYKIRQNPFEGENINELKLMKSLVAYIARRYHDDDLYEFARIMRFAIDEIDDNPNKFKHFCSFFDAVLLFFRANGGK